MDFDKKLHQIRAVGVTDLTALVHGSFSLGEVKAGDVGKAVIGLDTTAGDIDISTDMPTTLLDASGKEVLTEGFQVRLVKESSEAAGYSMTFVDPVLGGVPDQFSTKFEYLDISFDETNTQWLWG